MKDREENIAPELVPYRCQRCDSIVPEGSERCVMCGEPRLIVRAEARSEAPAMLQTAGDVIIEEGSATTVVESEIAAENPGTQSPPVFKTCLQKSRSSIVFWIVAVIVVAGLTMTWLNLRNNGSVVMAAFIATATPLPPTPTDTPTITPLPTETAQPTETLPPTGTPEPTGTPKDPRFHTVSEGETLFGLSLLYRISAESIAQANSFELSAPIQSGQNLSIPWPTATPPLESVLITINGEEVLADATNCEIITIQSGDSAYGISALRGVPLDAIIAVNRQTQDSIQLLQPGDTLCIPQLLYGDTIPPTAGPSPTPSVTPPPSGPSLLYPVEGAVVDEIDKPLVFQWAAVKDLDANEWYMVELRDLGDRDSLPKRGFTRDQSFHLPLEWRPSVDELRQMQWSVSIVQVTGRRSDGGFIYTFGGHSSRPSNFYWQGAIPSPTPLPSATPTPEQ